MSTLNVTQLAERWDTTPGRLANMRSQGVGPSYFKIGARVLYLHDVICEFENQRMVATTGAV